MRQMIPNPINALYDLVNRCHIPTLFIFMYLNALLLASFYV